MLLLILLLHLIPTREEEERIIRLKKYEDDTEKQEEKRKAAASRSREREERQKLRRQHSFQVTSLYLILWLHPSPISRMEEVRSLSMNARGQRQFQKSSKLERKQNMKTT